MSFPAQRSGMLVMAWTNLEAFIHRIFLIAFLYLCLVILLSVCLSVCIIFDLFSPVAF